eukprot:4567007-Amphidinium_carterae.1
MEEHLTANIPEASSIQFSKGGSFFKVLANQFRSSSDTGFGMAHAPNRPFYGKICKYQHWDSNA